MDSFTNCSTAYFSIDVSKNDTSRHLQLKLRGWAEKFIGWLRRGCATWQALNSTFRDTNWSLSFQRNTHWISNSGLWKVVLETIQNGLENWQRESCFTGQCSCTLVCGCNGCCAWLWLWTGWSPSIFSWIYTILTIFYSPNMKKHLAVESSIGPMMRSYLQLRTFFEDLDESFYTTEIQALQHCTTGETTLQTLTTFGQIQPLNHSQPMNFSAHAHMPQNARVWHYLWSQNSTQ